MSKTVGVTGTHIATGVGRSAVVGGIAGALIGGTISAAKQIKDVKENKKTKEEAVKETLKDTAGAGLATATGMVIVGALGFTGLSSLLLMAGAATGVKYLWDSSTQTSKQVKGDK